MIDNLASAGMRVSPADISMLDAYSRGRITGRDMLAHSRQFPTLEAYHSWLQEHRDTPINEATSDVSIEQALREFRECVQRRQGVSASE